MEALIILDMLNDFVDGPLASGREKRIIPGIKKLSLAFRSKGMPVIFSSDSHLAGIDKELSVWGNHAIKGTDGAEVISELKPEESDFVIPKRRYSGFFGTDLDLLLRELGVTGIVLTGLHANLCVRHTAADAYFLGYRITIPKNCVEALSQKEYEDGLQYLKRYYGATVVETLGVENVI